jgi:hypothetical protein
MAADDLLQGDQEEVTMLLDLEPLQDEREVPLEVAYGEIPQAETGAGLNVLTALPKQGHKRISDIATSTEISQTPDLTKRERRKHGVELIRCLITGLKEPCNVTIEA